MTKFCAEIPDKDLCYKDEERKLDKVLKECRDVFSLDWFQPHKF